MTDEEQRKVFARNLNDYIYKSGKMQKEVAQDLGISATTFNNWCVGKILPRVGRIQMLADYFGINKSDLVDDKGETESYYISPETSRIAQEVLDDPNLRLLFEAAKGSRPENIRLAAEMLKRFKETNPNG